MTNTYDYQRIEKAIVYIEQNLHLQPDNAQIADAVAMSQSNFEHLFTSWAGTSPQRFMRFLTKEYAKKILNKNLNLAQTTLDLGLSSTSRLHDLLVSFEAMTPAEYKNKGLGLGIEYGLAASPFGPTAVFVSERGIIDISFLQNNDIIEALIKVKAEFPNAKYVENHEKSAEIVNQIFANKGQSKPFHLLLHGTNFQIKVWEALLKLPLGDMVSYEDIANTINKPTAQRAVGSAIGANNIAYLIPCHRVINKIGASGHYRWGAERKRAMLAWEAVHIQAV